VSQFWSDRIELSAQGLGSCMRESEVTLLRACFG
jgi:hypothetical protein